MDERTEVVQRTIHYLMRAEEVRILKGEDRDLFCTGLLINQSAHKEILEFQNVWEGNPY